eukprot:10435824-Heterocapsa_arctica.AAC.1
MQPEQPLQQQRTQPLQQPQKQTQRPRSTVDADWLPGQGDFIHAISTTRGAAGLDGWSAHEAQILLQYA